MNKKKSIFDSLDIEEFLNKLLKIYKELPDYLKSPTKKPSWYSKIGEKGKNSFEKVKNFLSKKL